MHQDEPAWLLPLPNVRVAFEFPITKPNIFNPTVLLERPRPAMRRVQDTNSNALEEQGNQTEPCTEATGLHLTDSYVVFANIARFLKSYNE